MSPIIINLFKLQQSTYDMRDNNKFKIQLVNTTSKIFNITYTWTHLLEYSIEYTIHIYILVYQYIYNHIII